MTILIQQEGERRQHGDVDRLPVKFIYLLAGPETAMKTMEDRLFTDLAASLPMPHFALTRSSIEASPWIRPFPPAAKSSMPFWNSGCRRGRMLRSHSASWAKALISNAFLEPSSRRTDPEGSLIDHPYVFQVHGMAASYTVVGRKRLRRDDCHILRSLAFLPKATVSVDAELLMTPCIGAIPGVKRLSMAITSALTQEWLIAIAVGYVRSSVVANH